MANRDDLEFQKFNKDGEIRISSDSLDRLASAIAAIRSVIGTASDLRVTSLSGTITAVTTVTGLTNIGGQPANTTVASISNLAYLASNHANIA